MRDEEGELARGYTGPLDLPDDHGAAEEDEPASGPSLTEDLSALFEDGKTYTEAEIAFQKSRATYVADRAKGAVGYALFALGFIHLALIALTIGVLFALIPIVGAWAATAIVTLALVIGAGALFRLVKLRVGEIAGAFEEDKA